MRLHLQLIAETKNSSLSVLSLAGEALCFVVEDGYREKKVMHETRIPPGVYRIAARTHGGFFNQYSRKFGHTFVPQLLDVPQFSDILIHMGNTPSDTSGCLIVGAAAGRVGGEWRIVAGQSKPAYLELYALLKDAFARGEVVEIEMSRERWMAAAKAA